MQIGGYVGLHFLLTASTIFFVEVKWTSSAEIHSPELMSCWVFTGVYITHDLMVAMCAGWDSCIGEVQSVGWFSVFGSPIRCHWLQTGNHSSKQTEEGGRTVWAHSSLCCWRTGNTLWFYILKFKTPKVIRFVVTERLTLIDLRVIYLY